MSKLEIPVPKQLHQIRKNCSRDLKIFAQRYWILGSNKIVIRKVNIDYCIDRNTKGQRFLLDFYFHQKLPVRNYDKRLRELISKRSAEYIFSPINLIRIRTRTKFRSN